MTLAIVAGLAAVALLGLGGVVAVGVAMAPGGMMGGGMGGEGMGGGMGGMPGGSMGGGMQGMHDSMQGMNHDRCPCCPGHESGI